MTIWVRGAGDIATGIAFRLYQSGFKVVMSDLAQPTSIRRTVCFSEAIVKGETMVEAITARFAKDAESAQRVLDQGEIAVIADPTGAIARQLNPIAVIDAILAKRNIGTRMDDAEIVVGIGPGFTAGQDCHAVVETMRELAEVRAVPVRMKGQTVWLRTDIKGNAAKLLKAIGAPIPPKILKHLNE